MNPTPIARTLTPDQATALVGSNVPDVEPNVTDAGLYADADTGRPVLIYAPYPADRATVADLRNTLIDVPWGATLRSSGMTNKSRTFGTAPRLPARRRESCRPTALTAERPDIHHRLDAAATTLHTELARLLPAQVDHDRQETAAIQPDWRIGDDTVWTSGVINLTSVLPYHRDGANFKAWSAMPVFRRGTRGGYLTIPEYGLTVACRDRWVLYFPGWELVHGVTPITKAAADGYRISVVFYSLQGTRDCYTFAKEQAYGARRRTEREATMLRPEPAADGDDALW